MLKSCCYSSVGSAQFLSRVVVGKGSGRRWHSTAALPPRGEENYVNEAQYAGIVNDYVSDSVHDYSLDSSPVGAVNIDMNKSSMKKFVLSQHQIDYYWKNGFVGNIPVLSEQECDAFLEEIDVIANPFKKHPGHGLYHEFHSNQTDDPNNVLLHCLGHWRLSPLFHDLIFLPSITIPTSQLILNTSPTKGVMAPLRFWHDQLFCKPAKYGGNVAWHQDYSYWTRTAPLQHMTVHVALEDQNEDNGCICYVPGSHSWTRDGKPLPITADDFADMESVKQILTPTELATWQEVPMQLKKGEAVFHHPLSIHGSYGNQSNRPRRAAVINYFADGTRTMTNQPLLAGVPPFKVGDKLTGQFFPLVFHPSWYQ
eukprot:m.12250 g.12250  ORF g.12250 m.12250 type:complete len:368 (-) comp3971_c0_seq1:1355-2458(-)